MPEITIHKVKVTKAGVSISYDDPTFSADPDEVTREGKGEARPSFYKAMDVIVGDVINICLLDGDNWCGKQTRNKLTGLQPGSSQSKKRQLPL